MFRRLRYKLALQFTALVFGLMLVLGAVFIAIEFTDVNRQLDNRLQRQAAAINKQIRLPITVEEARWLHREAFNVKLATGNGRVLYASDIFARLPVDLEAPPLKTVRADGSSYRVLTTKLDGVRDVTLQLAGQDRIGPAELPGEIAVFFIAAVLVSALTAVLGLWFARRSLAPAERMFERLTQFTHDASHELRTPLAVVNSELDLALRTGDHEEHIIAAKDELKVGAQLVDDLLGLAALDTATLDGRSVDMSALVGREAERLAPLAARRGIVLTTDIEPQVVVRADEGLAAQLVANLVGNAMKFTPVGGKVSVSPQRICRTSSSASTRPTIRARRKVTGSASPSRGTSPKCTAGASGSKAGRAAARPSPSPCKGSAAAIRPAQRRSLRAASPYARLKVSPPILRA